MVDVNLVLSLLEQSHPDAKCELNYSTPFELLVAVILSAQCTDRRVNIITDKLFKVYNTPTQFAEMDAEELEKYIFSAGFYHNKASNIIGAAKAITNKFDGQVPSDFDKLLSLDGVGRKTANVVAAEAFGRQAIAVDTHVFRVSKRIGLADGSTPEAVEKQLMAVLPYDKWTRSHHLLIFHGRYVCKSAKPDCENCKLNKLCNYYK